MTKLVSNPIRPSNYFEIISDQIPRDGTSENQLPILGLFWTQFVRKI